MNHNLANNMNSQKMFWALTIAVFVGLLLPLLVQDGMFVDGIIHSTLGHNLANGIGTLWNPSLSASLFPDYYEHPPLVFGIMSVFYKVLGSSIYVERFYSFLTAIFTLWGIVLCWQLFAKEFRNQNIPKEHSWLAVLLWIGVPLVFWTYRNAMLENTMGIFTLFSVYFISKSLLRKQIVWLLLGSALVLPAFLSKGPVGLFPLATPLAFYIAFYKTEWSFKFKSLISYSFIVVLMPLVLFYLLTIMIPELKENIISYLDIQLFAALNKEREITTTNRLFIMIRIFQEILFPILLLVFFIVRYWIKNKAFYFPNKKISTYFLLIGLFASIPIMISMKQRGFYSIPSIPNYILAISFAIIPFIKDILKLIKPHTQKWVSGISYVLLVSVIVVSIMQLGTFSRDEAKLRDIYKVCNQLPRATMIGTITDNCDDLSMISYFSRYGFLNLDCEACEEHPYFFIKKGNESEFEFIHKYDKIDIGLNTYELFEKR